MTRPGTSRSRSTAPHPPTNDLGSRRPSCPRPGARESRRDWRSTAHSASRSTKSSALGVWLGPTICVPGRGRLPRDPRAAPSRIGARRSRGRTMTSRTTRRTATTREGVTARRARTLGVRRAPRGNGCGRAATLCEFEREESCPETGTGTTNLAPASASAYRVASSAKPNAARTSPPTRRTGLAYHRRGIEFAEQEGDVRIVEITDRHGADSLEIEDILARLAARLRDSESR